MTTTQTTPTHSPDAPGDSPADLDCSPDAAGEHSPPPVAELVAIAVDDLVADRRNQRRPLDAELVASVAAHGVLEPILATPDGERPGSFRIVAGERRWRAVICAPGRGVLDVHHGHRASLSVRRGPLIFRGP